MLGTTAVEVAVGVTDGVDNDVVTGADVLA